MSTLWRHKFFMKWSMTSKVIQGHIRLLVSQNLSSTFVYGPILIENFMNANIMKTQLFYKIIYDLKCHFYVMEKFVFFYFKAFWPNYKLDLRFYGQILSLFSVILICIMISFSMNNEIRLVELLLFEGGEGGYFFASHVNHKSRRYTIINITHQTKKYRPTVRWLHCTLICIIGRFNS